jgi:hypothetical protein
MQILLRHPVLEEEAKLELWHRVLALAQEKLIANPVSHAYLGLSLQTFNLLKNSILSHPFHVEVRHFGQVRRVFAEVLFSQTFESLRAINERVMIQPAEGDESDGDSHYRLEQMCMIAVNNQCDIFIYYLATAYSQPASPEHFQLFNYLWLHLLKLLLNYAEQANALQLNALVVCTHDNVKRVLDFLLQQNILGEDEVGSEMDKVWTRTWDSVGAFFKQMKGQVVVTRALKQQSEAIIGSI